MKGRALFVVLVALLSAACSDPERFLGSGIVEPCAPESRSGQCQLRALVSDSLESYLAGAPQSVEAEHVWRMRSHEEQTARFDLVAGEQYLIIGACDRECLDIDLYLRNASGEQALDAEGNPIQDILLDRVPIISFAPPADGTYEVALSILDCLIEPCYAGLRVMRLVLDPEAEPRFSTQLSSGFNDPAVFLVEAGGDRAWSSMDERTCRGHFDQAPDVIVDYTPENTSFPLVISAGPADAAVSPMAREHDTTLMVYHFDESGVGTWLCDDDSGVGLNASLTIPRPSGRYAIWVGTYLPEVRPQSRLWLSERFSQ